MISTEIVFSLDRRSLGEIEDGRWDRDKSGNETGKQRELFNNFFLHGKFSDKFYAKWISE